MAPMLIPRYRLPDHAPRTPSLVRQPAHAALVLVVFSGMRGCPTPNRPALRLIARSVAGLRSRWDIFSSRRTNLCVATTSTSRVPTALRSPPIPTMRKGWLIPAALSVHALEHRSWDHWAWAHSLIGLVRPARFLHHLRRRILFCPSIRAAWNSVCRVLSALLPR